MLSAVSQGSPAPPSSALFPSLSGRSLTSTANPARVAVPADCSDLSKSEGSDGSWVDSRSCTPRSSRRSRSDPCGLDLLSSLGSKSGDMVPHLCEHEGAKNVVVGIVYVVIDEYKCFWQMQAAPLCLATALHFALAPYRDMHCTRRKSRGVNAHSRFKKSWLQ